MWAQWSGMMCVAVQRMWRIFILILLKSHFIDRDSSRCESSSMSDRIRVVLSVRCTCMCSCVLANWLASFERTHSQHRIPSIFNSSVHTRTHTDWENENEAHTEAMSSVSRMCVYVHACVCVRAQKGKRAIPSDYGKRNSEQCKFQSSTIQIALSRALCVQWSSIFQSKAIFNSVLFIAVCVKT